MHTIWWSKFEEDREIFRDKLEGKIHECKIQVIIFRLIIRIFPEVL